MKDLFKLGGKIAKKHQKERPSVKVLPSGTKLMPIEIESGVWAFKKVCTFEKEHGYPAREG